MFRLAYVAVLESLRLGLPAVTPLMLLACAHLPSDPLVLSEDQATAFAGNMEGLVGAWIRPNEEAHPPTGEWGISPSKKAGLSAIQQDIRVGMQLFCRKSNGTFKAVQEQFGDTYSCTAADGTLIGQITTLRDSINWRGGYETFLKVQYDSSSLVAKRQERLAAVRKVKSLNGPTGILTTSKGSYQVRRVGTPDERWPVFVEPSTGSGPSVPLEDVKRLTFKQPMVAVAEVTAELENGDLLDGRLVTPGWDKDGNISDIGVLSELPLVIGNSTGKLEKRAFSLHGIANPTPQDRLSEQILSMVIDPKAVWQDLPNGPADGAEAAAERKKQEWTVRQEAMRKTAEIEASRALAQRNTLMTRLGTRICKVDGPVTLQGFIERVENPNMKISVARAWMTAAPGMSPGGFQPEIIWDDPVNWSPCY